MAEESYDQDFEPEETGRTGEEGTEEERERMLAKVRGAAKSLIASEKETNDAEDPMKALRMAAAEVQAEAGDENLGDLRNAGVQRAHAERALAAAAEEVAAEEGRSAGKATPPEAAVDMLRAAVTGNEPEEATPDREREMSAALDASDEYTEEEDNAANEDEPFADEASEASPAPGEPSPPPSEPTTPPREPTPRAAGEEGYEGYERRAPPDPPLTIRMERTWRNARREVDDEADDGGSGKVGDPAPAARLEPAETLRRHAFHGRTEDLAAGLLRWRDTDLLTRDGHGWTMLHFAASRGRTGCIEVLLYAAMLQEDATTSASSQASSMGLPDADEGVSRRALLEARDTLSGWTPLHLALIEGHEDAVRLLLDEGMEAGVELAGVRDAAGDRPAQLLFGLRDKVKRTRLVLLLKGLEPGTGGTEKETTPGSPAPSKGSRRSDESRSSARHTASSSSFAKKSRRRTGGTSAQSHASNVGYGKAKRTSASRRPAPRTASAR